MEEGRGVYKVFVGRSEGKRPLGRPERRWEDNIKMDLREMRIDEANWIQLAQNRVHWRFCEHGGEPSGWIKKAGFFDKLSDYQLFKEYPAPWSE
jgi:hypothetical protein